MAVRTPQTTIPKSSIPPPGSARSPSFQGSIFDEENYQDEIAARSDAGEKATTAPFEPLWRVNDRKAQKEGTRSTVYFTNGQQYSGSWHKNKQSGQGTQTFKSGSKYEGEFLNGVPHGSGTFWLNEGDRLRLSYRGSFLNGKREGPGVFSYKNGERYDGEWKAGLRSGSGKMFYLNGDVYDGAWSGGKRCGEGTLYQKNGDIYQGEWLDDEKDGRGTFYYVELQKRYDGVWEKGVAKCGLYGALDQGDGAGCAVQLPSLHLKDPMDILTTEALLVHARRKLNSPTMMEEDEEGQEEYWEGESEDGSQPA